MTSIEHSRSLKRRKQSLVLILSQMFVHLQLTMAAVVLSSTASNDPLQSLSYNSRQLTEVLTSETLADNYLLTFSEDGEPETLPLFVLELYSTNGNLTISALSVVQWAMNSYLLAELNAVYSTSGNPVSAVNATVFSQLPKVLASERRQLQKVWGSQMQALVNVTFTYQPSPVVTEVAATTKSIMNDLTYFVANITANNDPELIGVYMAVRSEAVMPDNVPPGDNGGGEAVNGTNATATTTTSGSSRSNLVVIPYVLGSAAVVIALIAFLALRRRKFNSRRYSQNDDKDAPDLAYLDLESDFASTSFDHSVPTSSNKGTTPRSLVSPNGMDSTFDGLDAMSVGTGSPMNASPRCKSLMSGLSNASATTIKISNVARSFRRNMSPRNPEAGGSPTPKSTAASSLFAFLEDEAGEDSSTESKPSLQVTDVSDFEGQPRCETAAAVASPKLITDLEVSVPSIQADSTNEAPLFDFPPAWCSLSSPAALVMDDPVSPEAVLADLQATQLKQNQQFSTPGDSSTRAIHGSALKKRLVRSGEGVSPGSDLGSTVRRNPRDPIGGIADDSDRLPYWDTGSPPSRHLTSPIVASAAEIAVGRGHRDDETSEGNGSTTEDTAGDSEGESLKKPTGAFAGAFPRWEFNSSGNDEQGDGTTRKSDSTRNRRRADYRGTGDGSDMYQMSAMHPLDWSNQSADGMSVGDSTLSDSDDGGVPRHLVMSPDNTNAKTLTSVSNNDQLLSPSTKSPASYNSKSSRFSTLSESGQTKDSKKSEGSSSQSASRQLINDLVWLEKKIADVRSTSAASTPVASTFSGVINTDSLSYMSGDANVSPSSNEDEGTDPSSPAVAMQSIICRDCYAPPGKLQIVMHSTKDGPAVHTIKEGSNLEGQVFPGDLIIAVDNIDTRSHTAEQVMKMMIAKSGFERKITVLHYEE